MKKRFIAIFLSLIIATSPTTIVLATNDNVSTNDIEQSESTALENNDITEINLETDIIEETEYNNADNPDSQSSIDSILEERDSENSPPQILSHNVIMASAEYFSESVLMEKLNMESSIVISFKSPISEGYLTNDQVGEYDINLVIESNDDIQENHSIKLIVTGSPVITLKKDTIISGDRFDANALGLSSTDTEDGDLTSSIRILESNVESGEILNYNDKQNLVITFAVVDSDGNETIETKTIQVIAQVSTPQQIIENQIITTSPISISGQDRIATAIEISKKMYQSSDTVILTYYLNYPDALSAGPLAVQLNAPILLTRGDVLSKTTEDEIRRLGATKVVIMGGDGVITSIVENKLRNMNLVFERVGGYDRYETSLKVANRLKPSTKVVLASGNGFADAMSAGSFASINGFPILLTKSNVLTPEIKQYILSNIDEVIIMGGISSISQDIEDILVQNGKTVTRVGGLDRYDTAVNMATSFFNEVNTAVFVNSLDFADALSAVPYAAKLKAPILLTRSEKLDNLTTNYLINSSLSNFHFIGGDGVITDRTKYLITSNAKLELLYSTSDLSGKWSPQVRNGMTSGNINSDGISEIMINTSGNPNISLNYSVSSAESGWYSIESEGRDTGISGKPINGFLLELRGTDASRYTISYRGYIQNIGWSKWTSSGFPIGTLDSHSILAIEMRLETGNSLQLNNYVPFASLKSDLNLRSGEGINYPSITLMPKDSRVGVLSNEPNSNWTKIVYKNIYNQLYTGYAYTSYIEFSNSIVTIDGVNNGDKLPDKTITVTGDIASKNRIKEVNYYINGQMMGLVDFGQLSLKSSAYNYDYPRQTGYRIEIPANLWTANQINSLKVEIVPEQGQPEWEVKYLDGIGDQSIIFETYDNSFNYYLNREFNYNSPIFYVNSANQRKATLNEISTYLDPSIWITDQIYKYMFVDLGYSPDDYLVKEESLNIMLQDKGVLTDMGTVFLKASIDHRINPFYIISHSILETGKGRSPLSQGRYLEYYHEKFGDIDSALIPVPIGSESKPWFNTFGIGALDSNPNLWGAEKAFHEGWDSVAKAIYFGTEWIAKSYINRNIGGKYLPQNTNYKMRYNINENMFHQYATDIGWAHKQAPNIKSQFDNIGFYVQKKFSVPIFSDIRP